MKRLNEYQTKMVTVENDFHNVQFDVRIPVGMEFGEYLYELQDDAANSRSADVRGYANRRYQSIMRRSCGMLDCCCRGPEVTK